MSGFCDGCTYVTVETASFKPLGMLISATKPLAPCPVCRTIMTGVRAKNDTDDGLKDVKGKKPAKRRK